MVDYNIKLITYIKIIAKNKLVISVFYTKTEIGDNINASKLKRYADDSAIYY